MADGVSVSYRWPTVLSYPIRLLKLWLNSTTDGNIFSQHHPRIIQFKEELEPYKSVSGGSFHSKCGIDLPKQVETGSFERNLILFSSTGIKVYFITMRVYVPGDGSSKDNKEVVLD